MSEQSENENSLIRARSGAITGFKHDILVATTSAVEGRHVERVFGVVRGNSVRARHIGRDLLAVLRNIVGGEVRDYTKMLAESREQALDRMIEQAIDLGANAILEMRFTTSTVMAGAAELLAYGTAVVLSEPEQAVQGTEPA